MLKNINQRLRQKHKVERDLKISQTGNVKFTKKYWMSSYGLKEDEILIN